MFRQLRKYFVRVFSVLSTFRWLMRNIAADLVSLFAQNEQNMNAVERLLHYTELPGEGETTTPNDPPPSWPDQGRISFTDAKLAYREGLPLVLKGITFDVKPGEKVFCMFQYSMSMCLVLMLRLAGWYCRTYWGR